MSIKQQPKAVALISGGLDSMLAAKLLLAQGVHVEGLNFYTGFCHSGHTSAIRKPRNDKVKRNDALWTAEQLGIKLHIVDIVDEYKNVLINPKYGYGQNINPCLDCKIFMVKKAYQWMEANEFDFIITGEVIGQRPKSQRKDCMSIVTRHSGAEDRLLRPLCAKNLEPTLPERQGWVDREQLLDISGRGRKVQIALAEEFGFEEYAQPAGGCCVLTDESYSTKLVDLWQSRGNKNYELDDIIMLKVGRHIRPNERMKLIIGREEGENNFLEGYRKQFIYLRMTSHAGPLTLIDGNPNAEDIQLAAQIAARFGQGKNEPQVELEVFYLNKESKKISIKPLDVHLIEKSWYI